MCHNTRNSVSCTRFGCYDMQSVWQQTQTNCFRMYRMRWRNWFERVFYCIWVNPIHMYRIDGKNWRAICSIHRTGKCNSWNRFMIFPCQCNWLPRVRHTKNSLKYAYYQCAHSIIKRIMIVSMNLLLISVGFFLLYRFPQACASQFGSSQGLDHRIF